MMSNTMSISNDEIREVLGDDAPGFINALNTFNHMILSPEDFTGARAVLEAIRLAAYRSKIGIVGNWLKTQDKSIAVRRRKDLLLSLEKNLEENINTLKLAGRIDAKLSGIL